MTRIACLGWGSLIWDPRELPIRRHWFDDGPFAPVEFTRQSQDGRMTLVLDGEADLVRLLWAHYDTGNLEASRRALGAREGIPKGDWDTRIGVWRVGREAPTLIPDLPVWADSRGIQGVAWTSLPPKFGDEERRPTIDEVISHLTSLTGPRRDNAETYVRRTPRQIDTAYRRRIEAALGWCPTP